MQPQLATDGHDVYLACGAANTIYVTKSIDGGRSFAAIRKVTTVPSLALGMHRGPRIAIADNGIVVTAITGAVGKGQDGDVVAWRSVDGGATWSGPVVVNDVPAAAREGLHAMAASGKTIVTAWLDLRNTGTEIYSAMSSDVGGTWSPDTLVYRSPSGTICQCCHPSLAIAADGTILAMFRNVIDGHRDLYIVQGKNGAFGAAEKLGAGTWQFDSCPMDGGGVATTAANAIYTVWRRDKTVFLAQPGQNEVKVADGLNPAIAATDRGPVIAWYAPDGLLVAAPDRATSVIDRAGQFVALAATNLGVIAAWERGEQTLTRVVVPPARATRTPSARAAAPR